MSIKKYKKNLYSWLSLIASKWFIFLTKESIYKPQIRVGQMKMILFKRAFRFKFEKSENFFY